MFDVKQKRMATISGEAYANNPWKKLYRKNLKIKISDERKEKNAHAKNIGLKIQERLIDWSREVF